MRRHNQRRGHDHIRGDQPVRGVSLGLNHNQQTIAAETKSSAVPKTQSVATDQLKEFREAQITIIGFPRPRHNQWRGPNHNRRYLTDQKVSQGFKHTQRVTQTLTQLTASPTYTHDQRRFKQPERVRETTNILSGRPKPKQN